MTETTTEAVQAQEPQQFPIPHAHTMKRSDIRRFAEAAGFQLEQVARIQVEPSGVRFTLCHQFEHESGLQTYHRAPGQPLLYDEVVAIEDDDDAKPPRRFRRKGKKG